MCGFLSSKFYAYVFLTRARTQQISKFRFIQCCDTSRMVMWLSFFLLQHSSYHCVASLCIRSSGSFESGYHVALVAQSTTLSSAKLHICRTHMCICFHTLFTLPSIVVLFIYGVILPNCF